MMCRKDGVSGSTKGFIDQSAKRLFTGSEGLENE